MLHVSVTRTIAVLPHPCAHSFFFFNDTATTEIYTLSLHDALPICARSCGGSPNRDEYAWLVPPQNVARRDRKSTRLNSSHGYISYAVFCLKKKKMCSSHKDAHKINPLAGKQEYLITQPRGIMYDRD